MLKRDFPRSKKKKRRKKSLDSWGKYEEREEKTVTKVNKQHSKSPFEKENPKNDNYEKIKK